jgi:hypothetical protein
MERLSNATSAVNGHISHVRGMAGQVTSQRIHHLFVMSVICPTISQSGLEKGSLNECNFPYFHVQLYVTDQKKH